MAGTVSRHQDFASLQGHFHINSFGKTQKAFLLRAAESSQLFHSLQICPWVWAQVRISQVELCGAAGERALWWAEEALTPLGLTQQKVLPEFA